MRIGIVGLGKMGANMARRLRRGGIEVVAFDRSAGVTDNLVADAGVTASYSLEQLVEALPVPRVLWLMLPAGDVTQQAIDQVLQLLSSGDVLVDGANSYYKDSVRRAAIAEAVGIHYLDAGVSGGIWGLDNGYALMVGGSEQAFAQVEPAIRVLAPGPNTGWLHCGPAGSGHFVKMIHNGIEYGVMQAYAEGFNILRNANIGTRALSADAETAPTSDPTHYEYDLNLPEIAELWRRGSVITSWLLDLTAAALQNDPALERYAGRVSDSGEGRWTIMAAIDEGVPVPVLSAALYSRFSSRGQADFANKVLSAMRQGFGGHVEKPGE